jgi:hypothetical protein
MKIIFKFTNWLFTGMQINIGTSVEYHVLFLIIFPVYIYRLEYIVKII